MKSPYSLERVRADFNYLKTKYGGINDMCGTVCNEDLFFRLLEGKTSRTETYLSLIEDFFSQGYEVFDKKIIGHELDLKDRRTAEIKERYGIKFQIMEGFWCIPE